MLGFAQDARYALRQLRRTPAFTLTALITLALGIGVNAAMFSVIDQALLRRVPYPEPDRIVELGPRPAGGSGFGVIALPDVRDWAARSHSFNQIAYYTMQLPTLGGSADPKMVPQVVASTNLFETLGMKASIGCLFQPGDEKADGGHLLVLSWPVYKNFFHGDPGIVGRTVPLNGEQYTVIGVLRESDSFPEDVDTMYSPLDPTDKNLQERGSSMLSAIGRLRPGVSVAQAQVEIERIHQQLRKEYPDVESKDPVAVELYQDVQTDNDRPALTALGAAVLAVWLIACANVAGLMLTRSSSRRREIAIRGALGAGRSRLMQQSLTESLILSLGGGLLGLAMAYFALRLLGRYLGNMRHGGDIHIDVAVCAYLFVASCVSAIFFGLIPGWQASHVPAQEGLREGSAGAGTSRRQGFWCDSLVVGEIALTLALLVAGGVMLRTLWALRHTQLGFAPENLVTTSFFLPQTHGTLWVNQDAVQKNLVNTFYTPLLDKLQATPGIEMAAVTTKRALDNNFHGVLSVRMVGAPKQSKSQEQGAAVEAVSENYLAAFGTPLLRGRYFGHEDPSGQLTVGVINEAFAKQILPGKNPIGMQIDMRDDEDPTDKSPPVTIIGVIADSRQDAVGNAVQPELQFDLRQLAPGNPLYSILVAFHMDLIVRTRLAPADAIHILTQDVHSFEPEMALQGSESMQQIIDDSLSNQTLAARLLSIFGVAALAIAAAGIYGLLSYAVSQRTRELGIRLALGAQRSDVLWLVLRRATILLGVGMALGLAIAWGSSGILRAFLYGLHPLDAVTVLGVGSLLALCGLAASYLPARRAASTDPMVALRSE